MSVLRPAVLLIALLAAVGLFATGCKKEEAAPAAKIEIAQKTCPVMEGPIDPNIYVDYEGERIYFCCTGCQETFRKEPEKYLAKLREMVPPTPPEVPPLPEVPK